jgi:hypothetical protein
VITGEISTPKVSGKLVEYIEPDRLRFELSSEYVSIFRADQDTPTCRTQPTGNSCG